MSLSLFDSTYKWSPLERSRRFLREFNLGIEIDSFFRCSVITLSI
nr:MAG TPA: hypothetical protein [Bacteriophage sp.]